MKSKTAISPAVRSLPMMVMAERTQQDTIQEGESEVPETGRKAFEEKIHEPGFRGWWTHAGR